MRHLDDSFRNEKHEIYLLLGKEKAFVIHLNADSEQRKDVMNAKDNLENLYHVRLPAYCGYTCVSRCNTENFLRISNLLDLLSEKNWQSKKGESGFLSVHAKDTGPFAGESILCIVHFDSGQRLS